MKKILPWLAVLGVLAFIVVKLWPNEERAIRKRLAALAQIVSFPANEPALAKLSRGNTVVEFFTQDVSVEVEGTELSINDRNDLREAVLAGRANLQELIVEFREVQLKISEARTNALAYLTALAHINGQTNTLARQLKMTLHKIERTWLVSKVESLGAME